jgi:hypothetical protein
MSLRSSVEWLHENQRRHLVESMFITDGAI